MSLHRVAIGLGSNAGDSLAILRGAIAELAGSAGNFLEAVSRVRRTRPIGGPANQPPFLNACVILATQLAPLQLLEMLGQIERQFGRERGVRWAARTLDLDILLDDGPGYWEPRLIVPHPRLCARRFFLECLAEVCPEWRHPWSHLRIGDLARLLATRPPLYTLADETFPHNEAAAPPGEYGRSLSSYLPHEKPDRLDEALHRAADEVGGSVQMLRPGKRSQPARHRSDQASGSGILFLHSFLFGERSADQADAAPLPRLVLVGPLAGPLLCSPAGQEVPRFSANSSANTAGSDPPLREDFPQRLRQFCDGSPTVLIETDDAASWTAQFVAAVQASCEAGKILDLPHWP